MTPSWETHATCLWGNNSKVREIPDTTGSTENNLRESLCIVWERSRTSFPFLVRICMLHIYLIKRNPPAVSPPHMNKVRERNKRFRCLSSCAVLPAYICEHSCRHIHKTIGCAQIPLLSMYWIWLGCIFKNVRFSMRNKERRQPASNTHNQTWLTNSRPCMLLTCQWENESFGMGKTVMSYEICQQPWAHSHRNRIRGLTDKYQTCLFISSACVKASTLYLLSWGLLSVISVSFTDNFL